MDYHGTKSLSYVIALVLIISSLLLIFQCTPIMVEEVGKTTVKIMDDVERDIADEIIKQTQPPTPKDEPKQAPQAIESAD